MAGGNRKIGGITGLGPDPNPVNAPGSWSREEAYYFRRRGEWPLFPAGPVALNVGDYFFVPSSGVVSGSGTSNFITAQGTAAQRVEHATLYNKIGTNFGVGDGNSTFTLPNVSDEYGYLKPDITRISGATVSGTLPAHTHNFFAQRGTGGAGLHLNRQTPVSVSGWSSYDGSINNGRFKEATCCIAALDIDYPIGSIISVMLPVSLDTLAATLPSNVLIASGQPVSRTTYSDLYEKLGNHYGNGDGSTTFNLPDYRGVFIRGLMGAEGGLRVQPSGATAGSGYFDADVHRHRHHLANRNAYPPQDQNPNDVNVGVVGGEAYGPPTTSVSSFGVSDGRPKNITVVHCLIADVFDS